MAIELITQNVGIFRAGQNLADKVGYAVKLNSFQRYQLATTGEDAHGILTCPAQSGQVARVCVFGITRGIAGEAFPAGRGLSVNVAGKLVESNGGAIIAYSTQESYGDGNIVEVFVGPRGGANVILDNEVDEIPAGQTAVVDAVDSTLVRAATWLVTIENFSGTGAEYFQTNASHIGADVSYNIFGWTKPGSPISRTVSVVLNGIDNLLELRVTNTGIESLKVKALQIRSIAI